MFYRLIETYEYRQKARPHSQGRGNNYLSIFIGQNEHMDIVLAIFVLFRNNYKVINRLYGFLFIDLTLKL